MNWFRIIGVLVALWGIGVVVYTIYHLMVMNENSGIGTGTVTINLTSIFIGALLFAAGLYAAVTGGRRNK